MHAKENYVPLEVYLVSKFSSILTDPTQLVSAQLVLFPEVSILLVCWFHRKDSVAALFPLHLVLGCAVLQRNGQDFHSGSIGKEIKNLFPIPLLSLRIHKVAYKHIWPILPKEDWFVGQPSMLWGLYFSAISNLHDRPLPDNVSCHQQATPYIWGVVTKTCIHKKSNWENILLCTPYKTENEYYGSAAMLV